MVEQYPRSFEAQLLRAGREVKAPDLTRMATLGAMGLGSMASSTAASAGWAAHRKVLGLFGSLSVKWIAIGVLAGAGSLWAVRISNFMGTTPGTSVERVPAQSVVSTPKPNLLVQPQGPSADVTQSKAQSPAVAIVPKAIKAPTPVSQTQSPPSVAMTRESLGAEVTLLDAARRAVDNKQGGRAWALLQQHDRQFVRPRLAQEAALLRVRALEQLGRANEAKAASEAFRDAYPQSPLAEPQE
jgi:hypothetical protein